MTTYHASRRTTVAFAAVLALLLASLLAGGPAAAKPRPPAPKPAHRLAAAAALPTDHSTALPRAFRDELTGDFLGLGYDQRMRAVGSSLNIYNPPALGGGVLQSTPLDLVPPPNDVGLFTESNDEGPITEWAPTGDASTGACGGCFSFLFGFYHLQTINLAMAAGHLFISGTKGGYLFTNGTPEDPSYPTYRNIIYEVPTNGSCADEGCARHVIDLPTLWSTPSILAGPDRYIGVTAMAAGTSGGNPYLAVGLSDGGLNIYDAGLNLTGTYTAMATGDNSQTPPSALGWDPGGSGMLAMGVFERERTCYYLTVNSAGAVTAANSWFAEPGDALVPAPTAAGFGRLGNGSLVAVFGMSNPGAQTTTVQLLDPTTSGANVVASSSTLPGSVVTINPVARFDGTTGGDDYAVFAQRAGDVFSGNGLSLRHLEGTNSVVAQQVTVDGQGNPSQLLPSQDAFQNWYPGYKQGRVVVQNTTSENVQVQLVTRPDAGYGCWFANSWADAAAFPSQPFSLGPGGSSATYAIGGYTGGTQGLCGATDVTGGWRGYLVVTPVDHPAGARLVDIQLGRDWSVDLSDQAGGSTTVTATRVAGGAAFGTWRITIGEPAAPTPQTAPTVVGNQLTPADQPGPAVYRLDVSGSAFSLPARVQSDVPALRAQGSIDGTVWTTLGALVPRTAMSVSNGELSVGRASFWWENDAGQPAYRFLRVLATGGGTQLASASVDLTQLTPPADPTNVTGPSIAPVTADTVARPVGTGVDQAPLKVQVLDANSNPLPVTDPSYGRIYYRDSDNDLLTNLFLSGGDPDSFVGVSPYAGVYANNGSLQSTRRGTLGPDFDYVSTTSTADQNIFGYVGGALTGGQPTPTQPIDVQASTFAPTPTATNAADGISLEGCSGDFTGSSTCRLAALTVARPALYLGPDDSDGLPQIGVLSVSPATTSVTSLPLQQRSALAEHTLGSSALTVSATSARLPDTSMFWASDTIDTTLVTHGLIVPVVGVTSGGTS